MAGDNGVLILKDVFFSQGFVYHKSVINPNVSPVPILIVLLQFCLCFLSIRVFICVFCPLSGLSQRRVGSAHL